MQTIEVQSVQVSLTYSCATFHLPVHTQEAGVRHRAKYKISFQGERLRQCIILMRASVAIEYASDKLANWQTIGFCSIQSNQLYSKPFPVVYVCWLSFRRFCCLSSPFCNDCKRKSVTARALVQSLCGNWQLYLCSLPVAR